MNIIAKQKQPIKNKWKKLFYSLLTLNIAGLLIIITLIFWPIPTTETPTGNIAETEEGSQFVVRTTKKNLNELVNAYIDKFQEGTNHQYSISLENDVHLLGELPIFSTTVPLSLHLEPFVQADGNVILKQNSISIGLLELPNKKIMEYMEKHLPMPEWVTINPSEEEIYVAVSEMDIKSNFEVSVKHFDLEANNLAFNIKVPYKTLGIETIQE